MKNTSCTPTHCAPCERSRLVRFGLGLSVGLIVAGVVTLFTARSTAQSPAPTTAQAASAATASKAGAAPAAPAAPAEPSPALAPKPVPAETMAHSCAACHGTYGRLEDEYFKPLAGMPAEQFVRTMIDFREGRRASTLMGHVAKGFTDDDLRAMGAYFQSIPERP